MHASLDVRQGEIVGLIGPNGAGKTTLFAAIAGFHKPDSGRVTFDGQDITGLPPHRICAAGMVRTFQITQPFAQDQRAREHHGRRLLPHGRPARWRDARPNRWPRMVGMAGQLDQTAPTSPSPGASGSSSRARSPPDRACCCSTR